MQDRTWNVREGREEICRESFAKAVVFGDPSEEEILIDLIGQLEAVDLVCKVGGVRGFPLKLRIGVRILNSEILDGLKAELKIVAQRITSERVC